MVTKNEENIESSFFVDMSACSICGQESHGLRVCRELLVPLRDGFYKPQGGGGGHSHDDDEHIDSNATQPPAPIDPQQHFLVKSHPFRSYDRRHDGVQHREEFSIIPTSAE